MKGYLIWVIGLLAFCTALFVTACAEDSAWGASYEGAQLQQGGRPSVPIGEAPPVSGSVPYVHEGPY